MNDIKLYRAWDIAYPVGFYYIITNITAFLITMIVPYSTKSYGFIKVLTTLITFPFIYRIYRQDKSRRGEIQAGAGELIKEMKTQIPLLVGIVIMGACAAVVLNHVIAWTPLMEYSANYGKVSEAFFGGELIFEILGPCILIPIMEEYVFRGLVYGRLREWLSIPVAVLVSALIFGAMHMNLVQFVYAGLLGIFMALCVERTKHLYGAVLAHMAANTISVIRTETSWFSWMGRNLKAEVGETIGLAFVFVGFFLIFFGNMIHVSKDSGK